MQIVKSDQIARPKEISGCAVTLYQVAVLNVKRLLQILGIVIALAWVPLTSHCAWESMPGMEIFKCSENSSPKTESSDSQKGDCADEACSQLETGSYKISETDTPVQPPLLAILFQLTVLDLGPTEQVSPITAAPPEIPVSWTFVHRTALPPRAPSIV